MKSSGLLTQGETNSIKVTEIPVTYIQTVSQCCTRIDTSLSSWQDPLLCGLGVRAPGWTRAGRSFAFQNRRLWVGGCLFLFREAFFGGPLNVLMIEQQQKASNVLSPQQFLRQILLWKTVLNLSSLTKLPSIALALGGVPPNSSSRWEPPCPFCFQGERIVSETY